VKYGVREFNKWMRDHGLRRLFLHAAGLELDNPGDGTRLKLTAPLPAELARVLASLNLGAGD
jgi:23S rRNA pseudouridine955/2504/2580 synthase